MSWLTGDADGDAPSKPLGYLLRAAAGAHRLQVDRALADMGITAPQFLILTLLHDEPGLSNADVARRTGQTMPTVSAIVQRLKSGGLIESRANMDHGRIRNLYLTARGLDRHGECDRRVQTIERQLEALATPHEIRMVRAVLHQIAVSGWL